MIDKLRKTRTTFVATTVLLASLCVALLGFALYEANIIAFNDDIIGDDIRTAVENHPEVVEYLETEHQNEAHFVTIANIIKNDQQQQLGRTILYVAAPALVVAGILGYVVARKLLKPVEEAYESQERFIADAAHELRNPLATMSAVVQNAARDKKPTQAQTQKYFQQMRRQIGRMVRINEDLLYLERNIDKYEDEPSNLSDLLRDVVEDMQPSASDRKLRFNLNIEDDVMNEINPKDFVRLTRNLIENAIKYSKPSSRVIAVELTQNKENPKLSVKDTGIGIPQEDIEHINERFFRASNVGDNPGSGLGLSIVHKIVDQQNGKLEIVSKKGRGTTVVVYL